MHPANRPCYLSDQTCVWPTGISATSRCCTGCGNRGFAKWCTHPEGSCPRALLSYFPVQNKIHRDNGTCALRARCLFACHSSGAPRGSRFLCAEHPARNGAYSRARPDSKVRRVCAVALPLRGHLHVLGVCSAAACRGANVVHENSLRGHRGKLCVMESGHRDRQRRFFLNARASGEDV